MLCGKGIEIEINRIVDTGGNIIGLGPRPGFRSLAEQINSLDSVFYGKDIALVEDGTFTGSTLLKALKLLPRRVRSIIVGIGFPGALEAIKRDFQGDLAVIEHIENPLDWMPDYDFFPFTPNCGRIIGTLSGVVGDGIPSHVWKGSLEGFSFCFPYIKPFTPAMSTWTSIPEEQTLPLSRFCLDAAIRIYDLLEKINGRQINISNLMRVRPRISIPIHRGDNIFGDYRDCRVLSALKCFRVELN